MANDSETSLVPGRKPNRAVVLVALVGAFLLWSALGENGAFKLLEVMEYRTELAERKDALEVENKHLEQEIYALQHDNTYIEQVARGTLSLVREGETVYQFSKTGH